VKQFFYKSYNIHNLSSSISNLYQSEIQHFKSPITTGLTARLLSLEQWK